MTVRTARDALLLMLWGEGGVIDRRAEGIVILRDRLDPTGRKSIPLSSIYHVGRHYLETDDGMIPLHRVLMVRRGEETIWSREDRGSL